MTATLLGLGTALPRFAVPQSVSARMSQPMCCHSDEQRRLFPILYRKSQIQSRHSVLLKEGNGQGPTQSFFQPAHDADDAGPTTAQRMASYAEHAAPLAQSAAAAALHEAKLTAGQIDQLVTVSCTGFAAPGVDIALIKALGLKLDVARTHIGFMGCHGAFNALRVAGALSSRVCGPGRVSEHGPGHGPEHLSAPASRVLVCAVELCSLHFAYGWDPQRIVANALFADGAAAAVVGPGEGAGHADAWPLCGHGSVIVPESEDAMTWHISDHGFDMRLSPRVPELIQTHLRPWLASWLRGMGLDIAGVASWAVHPGGPRILSAVEDALRLPPTALDDSRAVLRECGNMSSPTVLFILDRLRRRQAPRPCVALGFGPGLTVEAMAFGESEK